MVDAIAAASQREAEAHETAIILSKENDELRAKLKMLIDDNNKLIELYDHAVSDNQKNISRVEESQKNHVDQSEFAQKESELRKAVENLERQLAEMHEENDRLLGLYEKAMQERDELRVEGSQRNDADQTELAQKEIELRRVIENLENKLAEMHEENDKLLGLYEKAMQERDELNRVEESQRNHVDQTEFGQKEIEFRRLNEKLEHPLAEMHEENDRLLGLYEKAMQEGDELKRLISSSGRNTRVYGGNEVQMNDLHEDNLVEVNVEDDRSQCSSQTSEFHDPDEHMVEKLTFWDERNQVDNLSNNLQEKFDRLQEMLSNSSENVCSFASLEKQIIDVDQLSRNIQKVKDDVLVKQKDYTSTNLLISDLKQQESMLERKLTALRFSMSNFSKSLSYFEQREAHAQAKLHAASSHLKSKNNELTRVLTIKEEHEHALLKIEQLEAVLKSDIAVLKLKTEEVNKKRENDKVLLAIDNVNWQLAGKATELLKSEEEKTKLQHQMNQDQEKHAIIRKESEKIIKKLQYFDKEKHVIECEIEKCTKSMEETERKLQSNIQEKQTVLEMKESGKTEFDNLFIEFQETLFVVKLKEEEMVILSEEVDMGVKRLEIERGVCMQKMSDMVEEARGGLLFGKMVEDLESICSSFMELKLMCER